MRANASNSQSKAASRRRRRASIAAAIAGVTALAAGGAALGQSLQGELDQKRSALQQKAEQRGVLSSDIARYSEQINRLAGEVATLRNREAIVAEELAEAEAELEAERERLADLKVRLKRSRTVLADRLVAIYKSDEPDVLTVILNADGFSDLLERYEYLGRIEQSDTEIAIRVRALRDESKDAVERIEAARNRIAAKKRELERTRSQLEAREGRLANARSGRQQTLQKVRGEMVRLEGDIGELEDQIQAELRAAQAASAPTGSSGGDAGTAQLPAGPIRGGSSGMVWPVNGPVTSPYGPRWGRLHAGIDIAAPSGTPIRAVKAGNIAFSGAYGGYGNFTCIDHGGGLSSCYAHLSSFSVTSGSVSQGQVIGLVGCTGSCFGDHLHFEIRVNGNAVDPMGYL